MKIATWSSATLLIYVALLTLTPARYVGLGPGVTPDRLILTAGVSVTVILLLVRALRLRLEPSISLYTVTLLAPALGILAVGLSSIYVQENGLYDLSDSLETLLVQVFTVLLAIYLANNASVFGAPVGLLSNLVLILALASVTGILLTLAGLTPLDILGWLGLEAPDQPTGLGEESLLATVDVRYFGLPRAQGFFGHPIEYGATLVLAYAVARSSKDIVRRKYVRWPVYSILLLGILFSGTRGALLGVALVELAIRYLRFERRGRLLAKLVLLPIAVALLAVSFDAIASYLNGLRSSTDPLSASIALRFVDYEAVFQALREHPFGVGYANWAGYAESHGYDYKVSNLDNDYLRFLAEGGILGLLAYLMFAFRGALPLPYDGSKHDNSTALLVTAVYAWQAVTFDAFAFQSYTVVYVVLLTISLRLRKADK